MRIHKISLQNFRSIPNLKLETLHNLNCFIGAHNSGKTNVLDGISFFWDPFLRARVQQNQLKKESLGQIVHQAPILSYISDSNTIRGNFELEVKENLESWRDNSYLQEIFAKTASLHTQNQPYDFLNNLLEKLKEITNLSNISAFKFVMTLSQEQLLFIAQKCFLKLGNELLPFNTDTLSILQQAIGTAFIRRFDEKTEYEFLNENIARIIKYKDYKAITALETFLKDVIGQEFIFELSQNQTVEVTIEQAFTSPLWRMSTGTIRIISLAYLLTASPTNQIIIIDDPGLYLHPKSERKLARKLEEFSSLNHQIFFSTHSTRLLIGHAYLVELRKGWTRVLPIRGEKSMKKVVNLLGIRPSDSLGSDIVVFVEGITDTKVFRTFEEKLLGNQIPRNRVSYIGVGGWTNMKFVLSIELLKSKFVRSRAIAITDGDIVNSEAYFKIKKNWTSVFPENTFISLREECIESLFLNNPVTFERVFSKISESFSLSEVQEFIKRNRERGISDKTITRNITERYLGKKYKSPVAERLAKGFKKNEIPEYLTEFFKKLILS